MCPGLLRTPLAAAVGLGAFVVMALPGTAGPNKYDTVDPRQAETFA